MPADWHLCFNVDCPFTALCLRYAAGQQLSAQRPMGNAVYPSALVDGQCDYFCSNQPVRLAVGFSHLFDDVRAVHASLMRKELKDYLGGNGTYYLYRNGRQGLTDEQQDWIDALFKRYGYDKAGAYDGFQWLYHYDSTGTRNL